MRRAVSHDHRSFELDDDPARIDVGAVWGFPSTEAYWGRWRERADVEAQVASSWRVVGAYEGEVLVGFARAVSDGVAVAYLADVFVTDDARGAGLGIELVRSMVEDGSGADLRWMLHTRDAHGLYERFGFAPADGTYLERPAPPHRRPSDREPEGEIA